MRNKLLGLIGCCIITAVGCKKTISPESISGQTNETGNAKLKTNATFSYIHPGMLHTSADLIRMQTQVNANASPWVDSYNLLTANSYAQLNYVMAGPNDTLTRTSTGGNYVHIMRDAAAAYQDALQWYISGNNAYADKAVSILNAWATTCKAIGGDSNYALASGLYGYQLANAAEILRSYSGWAATDFNNFKAFMLNVFYPAANGFLTNHNGTCDTHYWANWDLCNMATILSIGILCDDQAKFNQAITYFKSGIGNGNIDRAVFYVHPGNLGQNQEAGRDQGHATLDISLVGAFCQMAFNQGQDLFAYEGNKVLALAEYTAKYNLNMTVPYNTYNNCDNVNQTVISAASRGTIRPCWELIYNHYQNVMGVTATFSSQFATQVRPEGGGGNYGSTSGGFDQLGFGTLTATVGTQPIANGTYHVVNRATGKYLDNLGATTDGATVGQWASSTSNNQKWTLTYSGGYYKLICVSSGKALDSYNHTADASTVAQWTSGGSTNQQWTIVPIGSYFKIVNRTNGKCLDTGGGTANGSPMEFYGNNSSLNQQWSIVP
ncbi:RICIN domain-containing protein [Mucilaginibacter sp. SJ]|uniref:RICIN domain-containing protein n=1 Tax=Mucilaginibacter sp. SJ TaxID=3029053 RepID=UPI0023A98C30|nr:RICIN domain-containing protein [Mucilaginibacter sp. SJ]WEA01439.1 RICIN domain-containing protein [Mucilaginibacter sp. SJ]